MSVSPTETIVARSAPTRTPRNDVAPLTGTHARLAVAAESDVIEATAELVYQRDDLAEADTDTNDLALDAAMAALDRGDLVMVREQLLIAIAAEKDEACAVRRARQRRDSAHDFNRSGIRRIETLLTGQVTAAAADHAQMVADTVCELLVGLTEDEMPEVVPLTFAWPLDGVPADAGAEP